MKMFKWKLLFFIFRIPILPCLRFHYNFKRILLNHTLHFINHWKTPTLFRTCLQLLSLVKNSVLRLCIRSFLQLSPLGYLLIDLNLWHSWSFKLRLQTETLRVRNLWYLWCKGPFLHFNLLTLSKYIINIYCYLCNFTTLRTVIPIYCRLCSIKVLKNGSFSVLWLKVECCCPTWSP